VIRRLAEAQHGVVNRRQLLAAGVREDAIDRRVAAGDLIRVQRGVYAVGHTVLSRRGRCAAAVLALGPGALLSHKTAGALWELLSTYQILVDVTVPGVSHARPQRGVRIHITNTLHPEDIAKVDGIPITSVARTIVDLAARLTPVQLRRVIEQADRGGVLNLLALQRALDRRPKARGRAKLSAILDDYTGAPPTKSEFERHFLEVVEKAGLPKPLVNVPLAGLEPDIYWPQWNLVVELDSRLFHSDPRTFESDRLKDARLQRLGLRVLRITWKRLKHEPRAVIDDILALARLSLSGGGALGLSLARH
jgi:hypothetical protein